MNSTQDRDLVEGGGGWRTRTEERVKGCTIVRCKVPKRGSVELTFKHESRVDRLAFMGN